MEWWSRVGELAIKSKVNELITKMAEVKFNPVVMNISNLIISKTILERLAIPQYLKHAIDIDSFVIAMKMHDEVLAKRFKNTIDIDKFVMLFAFTDDDIQECIEKLSEAYNIPEISEPEELYVIARDLMFLYYLQLIDISELFSFDMLMLNKVYHQIADIYTSSNEVIF